MNHILKPILKQSKHLKSETQNVYETHDQTGARCLAIRRHMPGKLAKCFQLTLTWYNIREPVLVYVCWFKCCCRFLRRSLNISHKLQALKQSLQVIISITIIR